MITRKERQKAKDAAEDMWKQLSNTERWELGDALVWGTFSWKDYWTKKPPKGTISELEKIRIEWEETRE